MVTGVVELMVTSTSPSEPPGVMVIGRGCERATLTNVKTAAQSAENAILII
jgi:hypothetical protein